MVEQGRIALTQVIGMSKIQIVVIIDKKGHIYFVALCDDPGVLFSIIPFFIGKDITSGDCSCFLEINKIHKEEIFFIKPS